MSSGQPSGHDLEVMSVVGARPQFVKLAPVAEAFGRAGIRHTIVHTGQHYDVGMSDVFFDELQIPDADVNLGVGSGTHGVQTAAMLESLEKVMMDRRPDWVLTYGDTNSTLAAAIAAVKLHLPLAHLEAGLRSFNRRMPEEHNRVLTDHASDLLLAPSHVAVRNLVREGLSTRTVHVGDVMVDVAYRVRDSLKARPVPLPAGLEPGDEFVLATLHRAENTDDPGRLAEIIHAMARFPVPLVLAAHPRLVARAADYNLQLEQGAIRVVDPLPYRAMVAAIVAARAVVTDSGGLQKEAFVLGTPCVTLRGETEWTETVELGRNVLANDVSSVELSHLVEVASGTGMVSPTVGPYGDGRAADEVVTALAAASVT